MLWDHSVQVCGVVSERDKTPLRTRSFRKYWRREGKGRTMHGMVEAEEEVL